MNALYLHPENVAITYGLRIKMGQYFLKLHTPALRTKYLEAYRTNFGFGALSASDFEDQVDGMNLFVATNAQAIDGGAILINAITDSSFMATAGIEPVDEEAIKDLIKLYQEWFARQYSQTPECK